MDWTDVIVTYLSLSIVVMDVNQRLYNEMPNSIPRLPARSPIKLEGVFAGTSMTVSTSPVERDSVIIEASSI